MMKWREDQWVKPDLKRYRGLLVASLALGILTFLAAGALMFTSGYLIDFSATQPLFAAIYVPVVLTRGFGIGRPVFQYLERLTSHNWVLKITSHMRKKLYQQVEQDAAFVSERHQTGDLLGLLADDIGHLQNLYLRTIFPFVVAAGLTIIITLMIGWFDWGFALWLLLLLLVQLLLLPWWSLVHETARRKQQKRLSQQAYQTLTDSVLGVADWVMTRRRADFVARAEAAPQALAQATTKSERFNRLRSLIVELAFGLLPLSLLIWTAMNWTGTQLEANWVGAFTLMLFPVSMAFSGLAQGVSEWPTYRGALAQLNQLEPVARTLPTQLPASSAVSELRLSDLSFSYGSDLTRLIDGVSGSVAAGQKVAILGPSGEGKTTLLQLILGDLDPSGGQVLLDGVDVLQYQEARAKLFAVLDQSPFLFNTTVLNNLRLGNREASEERVWQVLATVQLAELVRALPQGLATPVEEAGFGFSGGERQRLALARVLLQDTPIVLLDEPTVGLDPITEQALIDTMFTSLAGKTVIWVTHHLQGVNQVDQVWFLEDGKLVMQDTPSHLAQTNPRYRQLYALDAGRV